ncbi:uncharacterized protein AB9W97_007603 [Spinachia spinachia]
MTTKLPILNNQAIKMVQGSEDDSADCAMAKTSSSTLTPPRGKPQRSFRHKQNTTAYVEGWDHNNECDGEAWGESDFGVYYLKEGGSQSETEKDKCSKRVQEKDEVWSQEEEASNKDYRTNNDGGQRRGMAEEKGRDQKEVNDRAKRREKDGETDVCSIDSETGSSEQEGGGARSSSSSSSPPARHRRVIRLYQYDEEGRRYGHLPDATPEATVDQRLKQRSLSLTRLNAIMVAAMAGPLDTREAGPGEERPHFHMAI